MFSQDLRQVEECTTHHDCCEKMKHAGIVVDAFKYLQTQTREKK